MIKVCILKHTVCQVWKSTTSSVQRKTQKNARLLALGEECKVPHHSLS